MKIHGHPQKTDYLSPAEWPKFSLQGHWQPSVTPELPTIGHVHLEVTAPIYGEITEPVEFKFGVVLFKVAGVPVINPDHQILIRDIIWDATGSSTPPNMKGDPSGEVSWTGKATLDPTMLSPSPVPKKGWFSPGFHVALFFDNKDQGDLLTFLPFFSMLDPNAPETPSFPLIGSHWSPHSSRHPDVAWGVNFVDTANYLPLLPINTVWNVRVGTAGYGARDLPSALFEQRVDLDLHHNIPGRLLDSLSAVGDINRDDVLDPTALGPGPHKMAFIRSQPSLPDENELAATLLVFQCPVGDAPPVETVTVPDVVGKSVQDAHVILTSAGLSESRIPVDSPKPTDEVLSQNPLANTIVPKNTIVNLLVSKGQVMDTWHTVTPLFEQLFDNMGIPTDSFRMTANGKTKVL
jgi:hypothetical protein